MLYLDTSFLLPAFVNEPQTDEVLEWLAQQSAGHLHISPWVRVEFLSVLGQKLRRGEMRHSHVRDALAMLDVWLQQDGVMLAIEMADFENAAAMLATFETNLRSADALHLAICARHDLALKTYDRDLAKIARKYGIASSR